MKKEIPELDNLGLRQFALVFSAIVAGLFGIVMPLLLGGLIVLAEGTAVAPFIYTIF